MFPLALTSLALTLASVLVLGAADRAPWMTEPSSAPTSELTAGVTIDEVEGALPSASVRLMSELLPMVSRGPDARVLLEAGSAGTYIDDILRSRDSAIARWRFRNKPLRVWVQPSADIPDFTNDHAPRVVEAFQAWDSVGLSGLSFDFTPDSTRADIRVTWVDRFTDPISGRTRWARDASWWITSAGITLAVHHSKGETLDMDALRAMAMHEVGHLIGLDHSTASGDIMAPRVRVRELSDADRATARLVYSLPAGVIR
jgi:hypothetical protein